MKRPVALGCFCWLLALNRPVDAQEPLAAEKICNADFVRHSRAHI